MDSRNPTGWIFSCAVVLVAGGIVSPHPHGLWVGGALGAGALAIAAMLAYDSRQQRRHNRIESARSILPRDVDPDDGFARREIDD